MSTLNMIRAGSSFDPLINSVMQVPGLTTVSSLPHSMSVFADAVQYLGLPCDR